MLYEHVFEPRPPYSFTPHLENFSLPGKPLPWLYDRGSASCRRILVSGRGWAAVEALFRGEPWRPRIIVRVYSARGLGGEEATELVLRAVRAGYDYNVFLSLLEPWPLLHRLASRYAGLRPGRSTSIYEALVDSIVKQRIALRPALALYSRLVENYGMRVEVEGVGPFYSHPLPERLVEAGPERLRGHGLTRAKAEALVGAAEAEIEGRLPSTREAVEDPETVARELRRLYGVGEWTAQLVVAMVHPMFPLGPLSDLAVQRGLERIMGRPPGPEEIRALRRRLGNHFGLLLYLAALRYEEDKRTGKRKIARQERQGTGE